MMDHLPGFWDDANWGDTQLAEYRRRQRKKGARAEAVDQWLHRSMGRCLPGWLWRWRESRQWPSGTGSYDACVDHYNWLLGAGQHRNAALLRSRARGRRYGFMPGP
jgi:hypothetical protein